MARLLPGTTEQHTGGVISRGSVMLFPFTAQILLVSLSHLMGENVQFIFSQSSRTKRYDGQFVEWSGIFLRKAT